MISRPAAITSFFFHNRLSLSVLVSIMVLTPILIPGIGVLLPMFLALCALFIGIKSGSAAMLGFRRPSSWPRLILQGAVIGLLAQLLFSSLLDPILELITGTNIDLSNLDGIKGNLSSYLVMLLIGWVIGGVLEELAFRGYLMTRVRTLLGENFTGTTVAVLLSAVPFGIAHMYQDWAGVFSTMIMGLILALLFVRSRYNLLLPMLVHGFANTFGITLIYLDMAEALRLF